MNSDMIFVKSASDSTIVINVPHIPLYRVWKKRGQKFPIERGILSQAYWEPSVEYLFTHGLLVAEDKEFLKEVNLVDEKDEPIVLELTDQLEKRMISLMPLSDFKAHLAKLSAPQIQELVDYAIMHHKELKMDRVELLGEVSKRNILKSIENYKKSEE